MISHSKVTNTRYKLTKWHIDKWKSSLKYIQNGQKILDIGCADCSFFDFIKKLRSCDFCCIDVDEYSAGIAKSKGYHFVKDLGVSDDSFDVITMWEMIEHIELKTFIKYLNWCKKHLKKNGKLIISTPNIENIFYPFWAEPTHIRPYSMDSLKQIVKSEGFRIVEEKKTHPLKHPLKILFLKILRMSHYAKLVVVVELENIEKIRSANE